MKDYKVQKKIFYLYKRIIYSWPEFTLNNLKKIPYRYEMRMYNIMIEYISKK